MSGRPKIRLYHYDSKDYNHKYLGQFESQAEVFKKYFDGKKGMLFHQNPDYRELSDGTFVTKQPIGREGLRKAIVRHEDPCVIKRNDDKPIEILNSVGDVVGEIENVRCLIALTGQKESVVYLKLNSGSNKSMGFGEVTYRYKKG